MLKFRLNILITLLCMLLKCSSLLAQDLVMVSVTPKQNPLPPQAMMYLDNPGRFIHVSLTNVDQDNPLPVRLEVQLQGPIENGSDMWPDGESFLMVMGNRNLPHTIMLMPGQTRTLTQTELNQHFSFYNAEKETFSGGVLRDIFNNADSWGLLPEGHYGLKIIVKSNEEGNAGAFLGQGICYFDIAYKASAPKFIEPTNFTYDYTEDQNYKKLKFPKTMPRLVWTEPSFSTTKFKKATQFMYNFRLTTVLPEQTPLEAVDRGSVAYEQNGLMTPFIIIPQNVVTALQNKGAQEYVAQVTAVPMIFDEAHPDYAVVENRGRSEILVLSMEPEFQEGDNDASLIIPNQGETANDLPVLVNIKPRLSLMNNDMTSYFAEPGSYFDITLHNTTSETIDVSLILQYYTGEWGICTAPDKQHKNRYLTLAPKEIRTLKPEEINNLAGDYLFQTDAITFKPQTGFIIGKPSTDKFTLSDNRVAIRVRQYTDRTTVQEKLVGKAETSFSTIKSLQTNDRLDVTITTKTDVLPGDASYYFKHPERLFSIKVKNLTDQVIRVKPYLSFVFEKNLAYTGDFDELKNGIIVLQPQESKTLTENEVHDLFGNFNWVYRLSPDIINPAGKERISNYNVIHPMNKGNMARIFFCDADQLAMLRKNDPQRHEKTMVRKTSFEFSTARGVSSSKALIKMSPHYDPMPGEVSNYFQQPQRLFDIEVTNISEETLRLRPQFFYRFQSESHLYTTAGEPADKFFYVLPGETVRIPQEIVQACCSSDKVQRVATDDISRKILSPIYYSLVDINFNQTNEARLVLWDLNMMKKTDSKVSNYLEQVIAASAVSEFNASKEERLMDIDVKMTALKEKMPQKAEPYFNKPYALWDIEVENHTSFNKKVKMTMFFDFENDKEHYYSKTNQNYDLFIELKPGEKRKLTRKEIHDQLSSTIVVRHSDKKEIKIEDFEVTAGPESNFVTFALYDSEGLKTYAQNTDEAGLWKIGEAIEKFSTDASVEIPDVAVNLTPKMHPLPADGNIYFKNPGTLFDAEFVNNTFDTKRVMPVLLYIFSEDGSFYAGNALSRLDQSLSIPAGETLKLTGKEMNKLCGMFDEVTHFVQGLKGQEKQKVKDFAELVNLKITNIAQLSAYDADTLKKYLTKVKSDAKETKRAFLSLSQTKFKADKNVRLSSVKVKLEAKKDASFPREPEMYFKNPGKYVDVTITNEGPGDTKVNLRLTYNNRYYVDKPDSVILIKQDEVKKLTEAQIDDLAGERELKDVKELDKNNKPLATVDQENIKFEAGQNSCRALVWKKKDIKDKSFKVDSLATFDAQFTPTFREVQIGKFTLVMQDAKRDSTDSKTHDECYTGNGYIKWNPAGLPLPFHIAVEYKDLRVNSKSIVTRGKATSAKTKDCFSLDDVRKKLEGIVPEEYKDSLKKNLDESQIAEYYDYIRHDMQILQGVSDHKFTLPVGLPACVTHDSPVEVQLASMCFEPDKASMNLLAEIVIPESDYTRTAEGLLIFSAEDLPVGTDSWLPETGVVKLITDFTCIDPASGFEFTFKSPDMTDKKMVDNTGCYVSWKDGSFDVATIDAMINIPSNDIIKAGTRKTKTETQGSNDDKAKEETTGSTEENKSAENTETSKTDSQAQTDANSQTESDATVEDKTEKPLPFEGEKPTIRLRAQFKNVNDWIGNVTMDDFELKDAPDYIFSLTGTKAGIVYDHSQTRNVAGMILPKDYNWEKAGITVTEKFDSKTGNFTEKKPILEEWQGFYFENLSVTFPEFIEINDSKSKERLKLALDKMIGDKSGFSCNLVLMNVLDKHTGKAGGWRMSIDSLALNILQNDFNKFEYKGKIEVPLLSGTIGYKGNVISTNKNGKRSNQILFETSIIDSLHLDFWLAEAKFDTKETYFRLNYTDTPQKGKQNTTVEMVAGGIIDITCTDKLDALFKGIKFTGLRLANFPSETGKGKDFSNADKTCCFNIGSWSLASPEKKFWNFPFKLRSVKPKVEGIDKLGLFIDGGISVMGNKKFGLAATTGLTIWSKVDWENLEVEYDSISFESLHIDGDFGNTVTVKGDLNFELKDDEPGFSGSLSLDVKNLFEMTIAGGYYEKKKTQAQFDMDDEEEKKEDSYKAAFFYGSGKSKLSMGGATLTGISGGLYIHYGLPAGKDLTDSKQLVEALSHPEIRYKSYGGAFGLSMALGTDNLLNGDFNLLMMIDDAEGKLSDLHLQGRIHALCGKDKDDGLINGQADILWQDTTGKNESDGVQSFTLNICVDAEANMKNMYEKFTGNKWKLPKAYADLEEFAQEHADEQGDGSDKSEKSTVNADGTRNKSKSEKEAEAKIGLCKTHLELELKISHFPNREKNKNMWHLYLGRPDFENRLRITFIDFAIGKDKPIGLWAKIYANAYLCMGNELPNNGALPELSEKMQKALGYNDEEPSKDQTRLEKVRNDLITKGTTQDIDGGIMFGAALGGNFGFNAAICYADVDTEMGFDMILKKFKSDCLCQDGKPMGGKNGFYATGQVYAMLEGEMGLMIDIFIYKGKVPLIDMGIAGLLRGGFPNPSWAYGRIRARAKILGGLIKFDSTLEAKVGRICMPEYGNPLDDIKIFSDVTPGSEELAEGWRKEVEADCYKSPTFLTSMRINSRIPLLDEGECANMAGWDGDESKYNTSALRTYIFHLDPNFNMDIFDINSESDTQPKDHRFVEYKTNDNINYTLKTGSLEPQTRYKISLRGYCKELVNGKEVDPIFKDKESDYKEEHRAWQQTVDAFFQTGNLSDDINDDVIAFVPDEGAFGGNLEEVTQPYIMLRHDRSDYFNAPEYEFKAEVVELNSYNLEQFKYPDIEYDAYGRRLPGQHSLFADLDIVQMEEFAYNGNRPERHFISVGLAKALPAKYFKEGTPYAFRLYRTNIASQETFEKTLKENYKNILRSTKEEREKAKKELEKLADDPDSKVLMELYEYYNEMEEEFGENTAQQRFHSYAKGEQHLDHQFTELVYQHTFYYNGTKNFQEQFQSPRAFFPKKMAQNEVNCAPQFCLEKIDHAGTAPETYLNNPYKALNYWQSGVSVWSSMPEYVLCKYPAKTPQGMTYTAPYESLRSANVNDLKISDEDFERSYAPEFAIENLGRQWHQPLHSLTPYTSSLQLTEGFVGQREGQEGYNGTTQLAEFVYQINKAKAADAEAATVLMDTLRQKWIYYTQEASYADAVEHAKEVIRKTHRVRNSQGYYVNQFDHKSWFEDTNYRDGFYANWINAMNLAMENNCFLEAGNVKLHEAQTGLIFATCDDRLYLGLRDYCRNSDAGLLMAGEKPFFSTEAFQQQRMNDVYHIKVCRPTGYDLANEEFTMRPGNQHQNQLNISSKAFRFFINDHQLYNNFDESLTFSKNEFVELPDRYFRTYILNNYDLDGDGRLHISEAEKIEEIYFDSSDKFTENLIGIESMPNLENLEIHGQGGYTIRMNLNYNTKLRYVRLFDLNPKGLSTVTLKDLQWLIVKNGSLSEIDLSENQKLTTLDLQQNNLTKLNLSKLPRLRYLNCMQNSISFLDLTHNNRLNQIQVGHQKLKGDKGYYSKFLHTRIVRNGLIKESDLYKSGARNRELFGDDRAVNSKLPQSNAALGIDRAPNADMLFKWVDRDIWELDEKLALALVRRYGVKDGQTTADHDNYDAKKLANTLGSIDSLDISGIGFHLLDGLENWTPKLRHLNAGNNQMKTLMLDGYPYLKSIDVSYNELTSVLLPESSNLESFNCQGNKLERIDLSKTTALRVFNGSHNRFTTLALDRLADLKVLYLTDNAITSLNLSALSSLQSMDVSHNPFKKVAYNGTTDADLVFPDNKSTLQRVVANDFCAGGQIQLNLDKYQALTYIDVCDNPGLNRLSLPTHLVSLRAANCPSLTNLYPLSLNQLSDLVTFDVAGSRAAKAFPSMAQGISEFNNTDAYLELKTGKEIKLKNIYVNQADHLKVLKVGAPSLLKGDKIRVHFDNLDLVTRWENEWRHYPENRYTTIAYYKGNPVHPDEDTQVEEITEADLLMKKEMGPYYEVLKEKYNPNGRVLHTTDVKDITELDCSKSHIKELTGIIRWMPALQKLNASWNDISSVDFTYTPKLQEIDLSYNRSLTGFVLMAIPEKNVDSKIQRITRKSETCRSLRQLVLNYTAVFEPHHLNVRDGYAMTGIEEAAILVSDRLAAVGAKGQSQFHIGSNVRPKQIYIQDTQAQIEFLTEPYKGTRVALTDKLNPDLNLRQDIDTSNPHIGNDLSKEIGQLNIKDKSVDLKGTMPDVNVGGNKGKLPGTGTSGSPVISSNIRPNAASQAIAAQSQNRLPNARPATVSKPSTVNNRISQGAVSRQVGKAAQGPAVRRSLPAPSLIPDNPLFYGFGAPVDSLIRADSRYTVQPVNKGNETSGAPDSGKQNNGSHLSRHEGTPMVFPQTDNGSDIPDFPSGGKSPLELIDMTGMSSDLHVPSAEWIYQLKSFSFGHPSKRLNLCFETADMALRWFFFWKNGNQYLYNIQVCVKTQLNKTPLTPTASNKEPYKYRYEGYNIEKLLTAVDEGMVVKGPHYDEYKTLIQEWLQKNAHVHLQNDLSEGNSKPDLPKHFKNTEGSNQSSKKDTTTDKSSEAQPEQESIHLNPNSPSSGKPLMPRKIVPISK